MEARMEGRSGRRVTNGVLAVLHWEVLERELVSASPPAPHSLPRMMRSPQRCPPGRWKASNWRKSQCMKQSQSQSLSQRLSQSLSLSRKMSMRTLGRWTDTGMTMNQRETMRMCSSLRIPPRWLVSGGGQGEAAPEFGQV